MKKYIRFDSVGGASGDMLLSALVGLGAELEVIEQTINRFFPEAVCLRASTTSASGLTGTRITTTCAHAHAHHHDDERVWPDAHPAHTHAHRGLKQIEQLLTQAPLSVKTRDSALAVFRALAEAEAQIHGKTPESVHFHEVGAWDSVADIVGVSLALEQLEIAGVACGPLPAGTGTIQCAHGQMPNPAPATQLLLEGMLTTQTDEPYELVTPTGAAILRVWSRTFAAVPPQAMILRSALGFGSRTLNSRANVLRATLLTEVASVSAGEELMVLETNLDDCNPEWLGVLTTDLLARGALDVWYTAIVMKKGRPATMLSVLTSATEADILREWIFRSTTTFGIRSYQVQRQALERQVEAVQVPWGEVPIKIGTWRGEVLIAAPEHEVCARLAQANNVTPRQVYETAKSVYELTKKGYK